MVTTTVTCPCQCGQSVELSDEGFASTFITLEACGVRRELEPSIVSFRLKKSAGMAL